MKALKFTRPDRVAPFTAIAWPSPGEWLTVDEAPALCRRGLHGIRTTVLPTWIAEELWRIELDAAEEIAPGIVVGSRGRLLARVEEWNDETAREFSLACAHHVRDLEAESARAGDYAADAAGSAPSATAGASAALVGYMAAHAAEAASPGGFAREREWQADWLTDRLGLAAGKAELA
jgi:hypothetical protein